MDVDQEPVQDAESAVERARDTDRAPDVSARITALVRLLARQAAREHLERSSHPDAGDSADES